MTSCKQVGARLSSDLSDSPVKLPGASKVSRSIRELTQQLVALEHVPGYVKCFLMHHRLRDPRFGAVAAEILARLEDSCRLREVAVVHVSERRLAVVRDVVPGVREHLVRHSL